MILKLLPESHPDLPSVYDSIGDLNMYITNWNEALKNYQLSYEIKKKKAHLYHQSIGIRSDPLRAFR